MELEKEWRRHPVLHIDVSSAKGKASEAALVKALLLQFAPFAKIYGSNPKETTPGEVFDGLIRRVYEQMGFSARFWTALRDGDADLAIRELQAYHLCSDAGECANGRTDMRVFMPDAIYVMELKLNGTAKEALKQIDEKGYALRYATDPRRIDKVGIAFSVEKWTLTEYLIVE